MHYVDHLFTVLDTAFSDKCCLRCGFCYARFNTGENYDRARMDATFNWFYGQYLDFYKNHTKRERSTVEINFYGGEPTVEWKHLVEDIPFRRKMAEDLGMKANFTIVSNLALLNTERLDWLQQNDVHVSCSIDGCQEAEDYWRKFENGEGASKFVFPNAVEIRKRKMARVVRMTTTPQTVKWFSKSVKFLAEELKFNTINCVTATGVDWTDEALETYEQQLSETTDWWIERVRHGKWNPLYYLNKRLPYIWGKSRERGGCGAGRSMVCADTHGLLWPCHRFAGGDVSSKWCLGDIYNGITNTEPLSRIDFINFTETDFLPECRTCDYKYACGNFCICEMVSSGMKYPNKADCRITKSQINEAVRAHNTLISENNPLYIEHMRLKKTDFIDLQTHQKYVSALKERSTAETRGIQAP